MPNAHFRVSHITRQNGQNAVASAAYRAAETLNYSPQATERSSVNAAAYRAGEKLDDARQGVVYSFVRKEGVLHTAIFTPDDAPAWAGMREQLWNEVERAEDKSTRRATARLARDFVASLPRELTHEQHREMVAAFVAENFTSRGLVADVAFHSVKAKDGGMNPHVHMMVTTRSIGVQGFEGKARWLDKAEALKGWRESWEKCTNDALEAAGCEERLSLKSYKEQGINLEGRKWLTRQEYELEEKGIRTRRGDENRAIAERNRQAANDNKEEATAVRQPEPPAGLDGAALDAVQVIAGLLFDTGKESRMSQDKKPETTRISDVREATEIRPFPPIYSSQPAPVTNSQPPNYVARQLIDEEKHTPGSVKEEKECNKTFIESRLSGSALDAARRLGEGLHKSEMEPTRQGNTINKAKNKDKGYER